MDADARRAFAELRRRARELAFDVELRHLLRADADPEVRRLARSPAFRSVVAAGVPPYARPVRLLVASASPKRRRGLLIVDGGILVGGAKLHPDGTLTAGAMRFAPGRRAVCLGVLPNPKP